MATARTLLASLSILLIGSGCASTLPAVEQPHTLAGVNHALRGKDAVITLFDGQIIQNAYEVRLDAHFTAFSRLGNRVRIPTSDVAEISVQLGSGAGIGALIGAVPGAFFLTGGLIEYARLKANPDAGGYAAGIGIALAIGYGTLGLIFGPPLGAILGRAVRHATSIVVYTGPIDQYVGRDK